jgi:hypothetical protein
MDQPRLKASAAVLFLLAMAVPIGPAPIRLGSVVGLILVFVAEPWVRQIFWRGLLAIASGWTLTLLAMPDRQWSAAAGLRLTIAMLGLLGTASLVSWSRRQMSTLTTAVIIAIALLAHPLAKPSLLDVNLWKYGWAWPVSLMMLCLAGRIKVLQPLILLGLAVECARSNYRSWIMILGVAAIVGWIRNRSDVPGSGRVKLWRGMAVGMSGAVILACTLWIAADKGWLGEQIARKQSRQDSAGFLAGRPESIVGLAYFDDAPLGYGIAAVPTSQDYSQARQSLFRAGVDPDRASITHDFAYYFRFHSIALDLWFFYGLGCLPLLSSLLKILVAGYRSTVDGTNGLAPVAAGMILASTSWDILFSPFEQNYVYLAVSCALLLPRKAPGSLAPVSGLEKEAFRTRFYDVKIR